MIVRASSLTLALALFGACHSPPSRFYTLSALAEPSAETSTLAIAVGPVSFPDVVDRPELVVQASDNEVRLDEFNRWAAPLEDDLGRVVAENLAHLLGTPLVVQTSSTSGAAIDCRVAIEVQRFDSSPGRSAAFDAVWTITRTRDGSSRSGRTTQRQSVHEEGYGAIAAAHSRSIVRMCEEIAEVLRAEP